MRFRLLCAAAATAALALPAPAFAACEGQDRQITASTVRAAERAMACLVNQFRREQGLGSLDVDDALVRAARAHSQDMVAHDFFSHTNRQGQSASDRARAAGYPGGVGENIAASFPDATARSLFEQFRASSGHRANMLGAGYRDIGVGIAVGYPGRPSSGATVTQMFGSAGGGSDACEKAKRLRRKLERLRRDDASNKRVRKAKKALRRARRDCA